MTIYIGSIENYRQAGLQLYNLYMCNCNYESCKGIIPSLYPISFTASKSLVSQSYTTLHTRVYNRVYKSGNVACPPLYTNGHELSSTNGVYELGEGQMYVAVNARVQTCTLAGTNLYTSRFPPENVVCYACTLLCTLLYT